MNSDFQAQQLSLLDDYRSTNTTKRPLSKLRMFALFKFEILKWLLKALQWEYLLLYFAYFLCGKRNKNVKEENRPIILQLSSLVILTKIVNNMWTFDSANWILPLLRLAIGSFVFYPAYTALQGNRLKSTYFNGLATQLFHQAWTKSPLNRILLGKLNSYLICHVLNEFRLRSNEHHKWYFSEKSPMYCPFYACELVQ